ncbi:MAG: polymer-forming cytoskeletal protein [Roseburia sp.]|nr:polymer-forming cytoskeletal protein [Roseburia sp.]MCM1097179.1 polymer-forming cytoskeletal protein [Ruminococcus flavefaciens]
MGFFSDLKEDLSQAVNELIPEEEGIRDEGKTEEKEISLDEMLKNIDDIRLEEDEEAEAEKPQEISAAAEGIGWEAESASAGEGTVWEAEPASAEGDVVWETEPVSAEEGTGWETDPVPPEEGIWDTESGDDGPVDDEMEKMLEKMLEETAAEEEEAPAAMEETPVGESPEVSETQEILTETIFEESKGAEKKMDMTIAREAVDETSVITGGMAITGDILSEGSIDILGTVNGNIDVLGKLNITGHINGNSKAAEIYAEGAKINGEVVSEGAIKIGASSVIIGNISATSAAIAGAVKGDIDVRGPVILDASAIVMGNIKSKSVQINNGAVIEGMCSQCYADVSPTSFFEDYKPETRKPRSK